MTGAWAAPAAVGSDGFEATTTLPLEVVAGAATSASQRSLSDTGAALGYATTRTLERLLSSCALLSGAPLR